MSRVDGPAVRLVDTAEERLATVLPENLALTLGGIAEVCRDGLMDVAVEAGLATALAIMNEEAVHVGQIYVHCGSDQPGLTRPAGAGELAANYLASSSDIELARVTTRPGAVLKANPRRASHLG